MSELLKKYESIDQSKLNEATIKILNRVKTLTADFTVDDQKNNKIAEDVLNEIMNKNPDAIKIVKRQPKAKTAVKKPHKPKGTHKAKGETTKTTTEAKSSENNIMSIAKKIQKSGEAWKDAMERAKQELKDRKEKSVQKQKTELEKLFSLVKTKKELQGITKSDIPRDAVRTAKPRGARVVTKEGTTSNQYGTFSNKLGRKYWETRDRHADRLAPNYPKDMPLLASGGGIKSINWANDDNKKLGTWLLTSVDGNKILSKSKNVKELEDNVMAYYDKKGSIAKMTWDEDEDEGLSWVTFGDLFKEVKSTFADGGGIDGGMNNLTIQDVSFAKGGSVSNERMYNFLKDDLGGLEQAIKSGDFEEVNRFFSYWLGSSGHLKSLETKTNERMYNFLKEDLEKLMQAVENDDTEEVERFFSYWGQHLESLKMANGGSLPFMTDPNFGNFQNTGAFADGGSMAHGGKNYRTDYVYAKEFFEEDGLGESYVKNGSFDAEMFKIKMLQRLENRNARPERMIKIWARNLGMNTSKYIDGEIIETIDFAKDSTERAKKLFEIHKSSFELGGAFMNTDLAGHTGGGTGGLDAGMPLSGTSGTHYTGLVGETGAMSSGELFMDGGAMMQNQQVINDASQPYVITESFGNPAQQLGVLAKGGAIKNQYEGRTPEEIWNNLSKQQRGHFIYDHVSEIEEYKNIERLPSSEIRKAYNSEWSSLDKDIKNRFSNHTREGQYAYGGKTKSRQSMRELYIEQIAMLTNTRTVGVDAFAKEHNLTDSELSNLMTGLGRKMISQSDFITALVGNKNNPKQKEVVAFAKSDKAHKMADGGEMEQEKEYLVVLQHSETGDLMNFNVLGDNEENAIDNAYMEADLNQPYEVYSVKKYANGGSFAPNVADGTQFMNGVYAKGGGIMADGRIVLRTFNGVGGNEKKTYSLIKDDRDSDGKPYYTLVEKPSGSIMAQGDSFQEVNNVADMFSGSFADGGSFAPNVSDGTAFMDNAYFADGGAINGNLNKKIKALADKKGFTMDKLGRDEFNKIMTQALVESLIDANFHDEAKQVVVKAEGKTKWSDELYQAESFNPDTDVSSFAREVSRNLEWDGDDILNAYFFVTKMQGSKVAGMIEDLFFKSKAKSTSSSKPSKYIDHADIESVTLNVNGNFVTFAGKDFLNGANLMEKGEDLSKIATYFPKRDIVKVTLKNGNTIKPLNGYWLKKGSEPMGKKNTSPSPKIDESKAHFQADALGNVFVDSNFVNQSQGNLPNSELKHLGFGEFYLETPDGNIDFIRTSEEKQGFVGRSHKMKGNDELVLKLVNAMKEKGKFEANQTFADGGSFAPNVSDGTQFMNGVYADGGAMQGNNIDAELEDFDLDNLDDFETMQFNHFVKSSGKVGALQILINTVEGDYSQLSPELAELAEMQMSSEEYDEATRQMRFERDGYANGGSFAPNVSDGTQFMNNVYAKGGSLNVMEQRELKTFVNSLFNQAKNKIANDKGNSLFVLSNTIIATKDSLGNPKFYLGVKKVQNSKPTYVVGSGFLISDMLVYESYKKDSRFLQTESIVEAKKFLTDKVKKQILHLKDRSVMADGGGVSDYMNSPEYKEMVDKMQKSTLDVKGRVVRAIGIDSAIEFYDADYPIRPYQLLERAVRGGYITLDEINERVVDSAMETAQDSEDMEEVGSSDFGAYLHNFLNDAGFKVGYINSRLTREYANGGSFAPNVSDGTAFMDNAYFANGGELADIQKIKKALITKAKSRGLYENFGQKEVRVLEDKYGYTNNVRDFDNWAMNFDLSQMANGGEVGKKKYQVQYSVGKVKYLVTYHDGIQKYKDGSNINYIRTFNNKIDLKDFLTKLSKEGYKEMRYNTAFDNGGMFDDNDGFMKANNENNYRYPNKPVHVDTIDESIDLTDNVGQYPNKVVLRGLDESIDLTGSGIRARMSYNPKDRTPEKMMAVNPRMVVTDMPMTTSKKHKND